MAAEDEMKEAVICLEKLKAMSTKVIYVTMLFNMQICHNLIVHCSYSLPQKLYLLLIQ
jgi:hypothetical protein